MFFLNSLKTKSHTGESADKCKSCSRAIAISKSYTMNHCLTNFCFFFFLVFGCWWLHSADFDDTTPQSKKPRHFWCHHNLQCKIWWHQKFAAIILKLSVSFSLNCNKRLFFWIWFIDFTSTFESTDSLSSTDHQNKNDRIYRWRLLLEWLSSHFHFSFIWSNKCHVGLLLEK